MLEISHLPVQIKHHSILGLMPSEALPPRWFALYTTSRHEKRVAQHLSQREIEFFLPLYKSERRWSDGSRVTLDLPLFPGYLFIHIQRNERGRVLGVPGALAVVGGTGGERVHILF
jgi:transcription antitermination factor NusG